MDLYRQALEMVDRHIAAGERHIEEQRNRILELTRRGEDTSFSHRLLANLIYSLAVHQVRREVLLRRMAIS